MTLSRNGLSAPNNSAACLRRESLTMLCIAEAPAVGDHAVRRRELMARFDTATG
jgi:hypothetical protein